MGHPLRCPSSPQCEHHWFYDCRVNRKRYRSTTETANKQAAKQIEARERSRVLEGRHGIRRLPDITFAKFAETYIREYAQQHKRSVDRDRYMIGILNRWFGTLVLHEITALRIEQYKRERLAGKWEGHKHKSAPKPACDGEPGTGRPARHLLQGGRVGQAARQPDAHGEAAEG
jgi:hypothetical protein